MFKMHQNLFRNNFNGGPPLKVMTMRYQISGHLFQAVGAVSCLLSKTNCLISQKLGIPGPFTYFSGTSRNWGKCHQNRWVPSLT